MLSPGINRSGLTAQIGENSKGRFGHEKTSKVFFTKSIKGTLMFINRILNMIDNSIESKNMNNYLNTQYSYFVDMYNKQYKEGMSREDEIQISNNIAQEFLSRRILYKCNLNYSTQEKYAKMNPIKKASIDYLLDDINEEVKNGEIHPINNMHTISGKGISKNKLEKLTINGSDSALDVTRHIIEKYKELHPDEPLPYIDNGKGRKDTPMLEGFYNSIISKEDIEKENNRNFINTLKDLNTPKDEVVKKDIEHEQEEISTKDIDKIKIGSQENPNI